MKRVCSWLIFFAAAAMMMLPNLSATSQAVDTSHISPALTTIRLADLHLRQAALNLSGSQQYYVIAFLSPECPLCQNYTAVLNQLSTQYKDKIALYGIIPGKSYTAGQVAQFRSAYKVGFPLLFDKDFQLTRLLKASTTPEVFLVSKNNEVLYSGLIDNWAVSLGVKRTVVTAHYLAGAIDSSLHGELVKMKRTRPVGCLINTY